MSQKTDPEGSLEAPPKDTSIDFHQELVSC